MKLSVIQENLKNSLTLCSHFISPKAQLPILGNIKLQATKSKLVLTSTNLETSVSVSIGAKVEKTGEITVPGRVITDIISGLSSGNVSLEVKKERVIIESGSFKSTVAGVNTSDFPKVTSVLPKSKTINLGGKLFTESLSKCQFAASSDETRPVLTGVLFQFSGSNLHLVATDGFRLSQVSMKLDSKADVKKIIVPKAVLSEIVKLSGEEDVKFSYNKKDNQVLFGVGDIVFSSRVIEGEFPDFEKIIPKGNLYKVSVDKHELGQAVKLASIFARESGNIVKLNLKKDVLRVKAESTSSGKQITDVEVKVETGEKKIDLEIAYNYKFLEDFLRVVEGDSVEIELTNPNSPGKFIDPMNPKFLHLIMSIRVQG